MEGVVFRRVCGIMDHNEAKIIDLQEVGDDEGAGGVSLG